MEKEAQTPLTPPRIKNIDEVLRELRGNQAHLPAHMVSLTEERYFPSEAMAKVENIATLMDITMDEDFLELCLSTKMYSFYISSKDIPMGIINALESLGPKYQFVDFKIDCEKGTLKLVSKEEFKMIDPNERGGLHRRVLKEIREGGLLYISFTDTGWVVTDPSYNIGGVPLRTAFVESID